MNAKLPSLSVNYGCSSLTPSFLEITKKYREQLQAIILKEKLPNTTKNNVYNFN